jgi:cation:H+ antiporter
MIWLKLALGAAFIGLGGQYFVRGAVALGVRLGIPTTIVAVTWAAFATSSPETSIAVNAALEGAPAIALGNALGANILNVALAMGIALSAGALAMPAGVERRDWPVALAAPVLTGVLALDGTVSRGDGVVLLGAFATWMTLTARDALRCRADADAEREVAGWWRIIALSVTGVGLLVVAGGLIVDAAVALGELIGWREFVIGATLVAIGTTLPEVATVLISRWKGHSEIGVGAVIGSNIFNGLFIVGMAAAIHPISVDPRVVYVGLGFGLLALLWMRPRAGIIPRSRSVLLLGTYFAYLAVILSRGPAQALAE